MAESATLTPAEAPDREDAKPEVTAPPTPTAPAPPEAPPKEAPRSEFSILADRIEGLKDKHQKVREEQRAEQTRFAQEVEPMVGGVEQSMADRQGLAAQHRPAPLNLPPPPSRALTDFLAPVAGETPQNTVSKMIQGLGLMAMGIGLGKGDARGALASLSGAMKGWHEGDKERADRHFADWQASTSKALKQWETEHKTYRDVMEDASLNIEDRLRLIELAKLRHEQRAAPLVAQTADFEKFIGWNMDQQKVAASMESTMARLSQQKSIADQQHQDRIRSIDSKLELSELKLKQDMASPFTDQDVDMMARLYIAKGQAPAFGMGASARPDRARFWRRVRELSAEYGGAEGIVARQNAVAGLKGELAAVMRTRGLVEAFSQTAAKNLRDAEALSQKVDRTGAPMINKWLLAGRQAWNGDPDVAEFNTAVRTAIAETARVLNSANASGVLSDTARREIEEMLNSALTKEQFLRVVNRLHKEMENRRTSYADQITAIQEETHRAAAPTPTTPAASPGARAKLSRPQAEALKARGYSEQQIRDKYDLE